MKSKSRDLSELTRLSRELGADSGLVQGRGGNVSFKAGGRLRVTASGVRLRDVGTGDIAVLSLDTVREIVADVRLRSISLPVRVEMALARLIEAALSPVKPSIESFLHAIMPGTYTVHLHPVYVNALVCMEAGEALAGELFSPENYVWVPYARPGFELACSLRVRMDAFRARYGNEPGVVLLQNHGIAISAGSVDELRFLLASFLDVLQEHFGPLKKPRTPLLGRIKEHVSVVGEALRLEARASQCAHANWLAAKEPHALLGGVITADQAVYCGDRPLVLEPGSSVGDISSGAFWFKVQCGHWPRYAVLPGMAVVLLNRGAEEDLLLSDEVLCGSASALRLMHGVKGRPRFLSQDEAAALSCLNEHSGRSSSASSCPSSGV